MVLSETEIHFCGIDSVRLTSNQKSVLEPVAKGKESGETKYLIQQYLHLRICKKQKYIDSNLVTILKRGAVDAAGT